MGTNYYIEAAPACRLCGRGDERGLHIGKSSFGWRFLFAPFPEHGLMSWAAWKAYLGAEGRVIIDEYGVRHPLDIFIAQVEAKQLKFPAQSEELDYGGWRDAEGYTFARSDDFG